MLQDSQCNFSSDICDKNLSKIENEEDCFRLIKIEGAIEKFGSYDKGGSGKLMLDFMDYCRNFFGPVQILDNRLELESFSHHYIVQNLF
jgi:hypothetical protein